MTGGFRLDATMREIVYNEQGGVIRNAFRNGRELLLLQGCSLPDVCVACGNAAYGNTERKEFSHPGIWWFVLPPIFDVLAELLFRNNFVFNLPFCANCPPDRLQVRPIRLDRELVVFEGVSQKVLDQLPGPPPEVMEEGNQSLIARHRWHTR
jgi:hypothetical protein